MLATQKDTNRIKAYESGWMSNKVKGPTPKPPQTDVAIFLRDNHTIKRLLENGTASYQRPTWNTAFPDAQCRIPSIVAALLSVIAYGGDLGTTPSHDPLRSSDPQSSRLPLSKAISSQHHLQQPAIISRLSKHMRTITCTRLCIYNTYYI